MVFDKGDVDEALAGASVVLTRTYLQPPRHHHPMETSGTIAEWDGDRLVLWDSVQAGSTVVSVVVAALGLDAAAVRVVARHTGGGFGCKGFVWPHEILAAAAARVVGRPVKLHPKAAGDSRVRPDLAPPETVDQLSPRPRRQYKSAVQTPVGGGVA